MAESFDLVLKGGTCFLPSGKRVVDIGISGSKIAAIGVPAGAAAAETVDVTGLVVLPGCIDSQVHFREPGLEHKEDLATGTLSALMGGITTVFEMPNTKPNTDTRERLSDKLERAQGRAYSNYAFFIGATAENAEQLAELELLPGACGVKVFMGSSTGSLLVADQPTLERVLASGRRRVSVHCEDEPRLLERRHLVETGSARVHDHPVWRDEQTALLATQRLLAAARKTGRAVHVLHVTTAAEIAELAHAKDVATVEVTPQHLTLVAPDCYDRLGSFAQMNPPIRGAEHQAALWAAVRSGVVDVIGSDHAPHTREEKGKPYPACPSGMPGVQTLLPLMLNHVHEGRLTLERLVDLVCSGPARLFDIRGKGRIVPGYDADLTIVDLGLAREVDESAMKTKSGWTPFAGMRLVGWPRLCVVGGAVAMREDELVGPPRGTKVRFWNVPLASSTAGVSQA
jgi:dihydroorotase